MSQLTDQWVSQGQQENRGQGHIQVSQGQARVTARLRLQSGRSGVVKIIYNYVRVSRLSEAKFSSLEESEANRCALKQRSRSHTGKPRSDLEQGQAKILQGEGVCWSKSYTSGIAWKL